MAVLHLVNKGQAQQPQPNTEAVRTLRELLLQAERGELDGFAYAALSKEGRFVSDVVGTARQRPLFALGLTAKLFRTIDNLI